jgi:hypothetical protein
VILIATTQERWLKEMRSNTGSRVPQGPTETLGAKAGSRKPKRAPGAGRVPGFDKAQTKKL